MERVTVVNPLSPIRLRNGVNNNINGCYLRPAPGKLPEPEEEEISIFDAKKYFNESGMEQSVEGKNRVLSPAKAGLDRIGDDLYCGARSFNATPTALSEASWNSQTGLLRNPPGGFPVKLRSADDRVRKRGSAARWLFGRKCPCSGKKSVEVEDRVPPEPRKLRSSSNQADSRKPSSKSESPEPETISISQTRNHRFSLETEGFRSERVLAPPATGFMFPILGQSKLALPLDPPRDSVESLEVFRPSNHKQNHQHRQAFTFPANPKSRVVDDDVASDASSDLFEIESFSTATTATTAAAYPMMMGPHRDSLDEARRLSGGGGYCRQSLDEAAMPSVAATECYEPSEASIDWSVTTAEGFDRRSLTNYSVARLDQFEEAMYERGGAGGGGGKRRSGNGLLSCRCEKAVSVGPHPQPVARWVPPTRHAGDWATGGFGHSKPPSGLTRTAT